MDPRGKAHWNQLYSPSYMSNLSLKYYSEQEDLSIALFRLNIFVTFFKISELIIRTFSERINRFRGSVRIFTVYVNPIVYQLKGTKRRSYFQKIIQEFQNFTLPSEFKELMVYLVGRAMEPFGKRVTTSETISKEEQEMLERTSLYVLFFILFNLHWCF